MNKIKAIAFAILAYTVLPVLNAASILADCQWAVFFRDINQDIAHYWMGGKNQS